MQATSWRHWQMLGSLIVIAQYLSLIEGTNRCRESIELTQLFVFNPRWPTPIRCYPLTELQGLTRLELGCCN